MSYLVWYAPSAYRSLRLLCQFLMVAFYICIGLFFLTGLYKKTFLTAPKFMSETNKGMRLLNIKLVKTSTGFEEKILRLFNPVYSKTLIGPVKLVLSTREFSPTFIDDWEVFRYEYWRKQAKRKRNIENKRKQKIEK